jgi:mycothiol synthase
METNHLTFRSFAGKSDYAKMAKLLQAIETADKSNHWTTTEDIERDYQHLTNSNPETDMCMVEDANGELVAYTRVFWTAEGSGRQVFGFPFNVHPQHRSDDLCRALLEWIEQRCGELASGEHPVMRGGVRNADYQQAYQRAFEAAGFQPVRYGYRMHRDLCKPIELTLMPDGLEVRPVPEELYRAVSEAADEAFRDHWGYTQMTEEMYQQYRNSPEFCPGLWVVAWDGDQIAGAILNFIDEASNEEFNQKLGWTDPIFVRRPWRRRGLARALLTRSLRLLKERGMTTAALGVDTQNESGALNLYQSCGFEVEYRSISYEKDVKIRKG